jgi:hypothetical protein
LSFIVLSFGHPADHVRYPPRGACGLIHATGNKKAAEASQGGYQKIVFVYP